MCSARGFSRVRHRDGSCPPPCVLCEGAEGGHEDHRRQEAADRQPGCRTRRHRTGHHPGQRFLRGEGGQGDGPQAILEEPAQQTNHNCTSPGASLPLPSSQTKEKKLVLEIVRRGVLWKAGKGQTVTGEQLKAVIAPMEALGFKIRREIEAIEIPEPSSVRPPSRDLLTALDRLDLHPALQDDITEMFRDGHLNEAVRKALERFEKLIQDTIDDHRTSGRDLMARAFGGDPPPIPLNGLKTANDRSEQEGFRFLTMGAMSGMRNLYSHGDVPQMSATDAIERLAFVSLLFKRVGRAMSDQGSGAS